MTAQAIAMGLRARYPLQAARAKAFRKYLLWMEYSVRPIWDDAYEAKRAKRLTFWTAVCMDLDKEPLDVS